MLTDLWRRSSHSGSESSKPDEKTQPTQSHDHRMNQGRLSLVILLMKFTHVCDLDQRRRKESQKDAWGYQITVNPGLDWKSVYSLYSGGVKVYDL